VFEHIAQEESEHYARQNREGEHSKEFKCSDQGSLGDVSYGGFGVHAFETLEQDQGHCVIQQGLAHHRDGLTGAHSQVSECGQHCYGVRCRTDDPHDETVDLLEFLRAQNRMLRKPEAGADRQCRHDRA